MNIKMTRYLAVFLASLFLTNLSYAIIDENNNGLSDVWEQRFSASDLELDGDDDADGFTNLEECIAGTDPLDAKDLPKLDLTVIQESEDIVQLDFQSVNGKYYSLEGSTNLSNFAPLITNWPGNGDFYSLQLENGVADVITSPVKAEFWADILPATLDTLTSDSSFPADPDGSLFLADPEAPEFVATGFGARLSLLITPSQTGSYRFYVSSAGPAELYFGTSADGSDANKIAEILPAQTGLSELEWENFDTQRSDLLNLDASENYYLELRYVATTSSQFAQIGWSGPGLSGIEQLGKDALAQVSFPSDLLSSGSAALLEHDYDQSGQTGALWPTYSSVEDGSTVSMPGDAEHMTTNTGSGSPTYSDLSDSSDSHLYASWLFNLGGDHGTLSLFLKNSAAGNGEEGPRIDFKSLSSGTVAAVSAGGTGATETQINVAFDQTFRIEIIASLEPLGFNYSTPLGAVTVAEDRFDIYISNLAGDLVGSATGLTFRDGGDNIVQQFNRLQAILGTDPNIYFDDWGITSGAINGDGYLLANALGGGVPKFFQLQTYELDNDGDGLADWEELTLSLFYNILFFDAETTDGTSDAIALEAILNQSQGEPVVSLYGSDAAAFESNYPSITDDNGEITLTREGSLAPLEVQLCFPELVETGSTATVCDGNCCMLIGSAGDEEAEPEDYILTDEDGNVVIDVVHFKFGETQKVLTVTAVKDSINEYPETLNVAIEVPEDNAYEVSTVLNGASVQIFDLPESPDNLTLFIGSYSQDGAATTATTATGTITATINGPRTEIKLWNDNFVGLTSAQTTSHVHKANQSGGAFTPGNIVFGINQEGTSDPLLGYVEEHVWDLLNSSGATSSNSGGGAVETSKQIIIDSLFGQNGETPLYLNVHTALNTAGEIWAFFGLSEGSIEEPDAPLPAATAGSVEYPQLSGYLLEVDVRRFMNQSTFGATEEMVDAMMTQIETARISDPDYHRQEAFEAWLDAQMDKSETTQTYLLDYLMATHFQLFWLSGVYDPLRNPTDGSTATPSTPSVWPSIDRSNPDPAYWYLNQVYPVTFDELELADANGLGVDRRFVKLPHESMTHWHTMLNAGDQLRQKMGFALQQIVVTSNSEGSIGENRYGMLNYQDMLNHYAFDYYRDVLGFVNWSPIMGIWLSSLKNQKAVDFDGDGLFDSYPDENLARENMQLFSIGLFDLWSDGTLKLSSEGLPRQTYTNEDIKEFARILTGQSMAIHSPEWGGDVPGSAAFLANENTNFNRGLNGGQTSAHTFYPMKMFEEYHSLGAKTFAGVTIDNSDISDLEEQAKADIEDAIDWLAGKPGDGLPDFDMVNSHVSTPAFISLRLIQRFTTSNPSKDYLHRVATTFKDSEGHLGLTLKAILLDPEARNLDLNDNVFGMKKSPMEAYLQMLRVLGAHTYVPLVEPVSGEVFDAAPGVFTNSDLYLENFGYPLDQVNAHENNVRFFMDSAYTGGSSGLQMDPFGQETVFNYYIPEYIPGGVIGAAEIYAPEMQIVNEADVIRHINFFEDITNDGTGHVGDELGNTDANQVTAFGGVSGASTNDHLRIDLQSLADEMYPESEPSPGETTNTRGPESITAPHWVRLSRSGDVFTSSESTDGITWNVLDSWVLPLANQVYMGLAVTSHDDGVLTTAVFDDISVSGTNNSWVNQDIGAVSAAGSVTDNGGGEYSIQASGADIWNQDDEFHFMHQLLTGDGEITAQLKSLVNTNVWAKAGVMIREDLSSDSLNVMTLVAAENGVVAQGRRSSSTRSAESLADEMLIDALDDRLTNGLFKLRYPYDPDDNGVDDVDKNPREWIIDALTESYDDPFDGSGDSDDRYDKLSDALYLLSASPEFQIRK